MPRCQLDGALQWRLQGKIPLPGHSWDGDFRKCVGKILDSSVFVPEVAVLAGPSSLPPPLSFPVHNLPRRICQLSLRCVTAGVCHFSCSGVSDPLQPHGLQHPRPSCPSPTPRACSNSCPWRWWCHPAISSSVVPFSSWLQSFPASESFLRSPFFASGGQSIGILASASVLPMHIQDWFLLGLTGLISFQSKGLSRILSNTTAQKHLADF